MFLCPCIFCKLLVRSRGFIRFRLEVLAKNIPCGMFSILKYHLVGMKRMDYGRTRVETTRNIIKLVKTWTKAVTMEMA